jgi:hypothetical protein
MKVIIMRTAIQYTKTERRRGVMRDRAKKMKRQWE